MIPQRVVVALLALLSQAQAQIDPAYETDLIVYHVNQINFPDNQLAEMNSGNQAGDIYFDLRSVMLPVECASDPKQHDCYNPEVNSTVPLTITKLHLKIDSRYTNYSRCNVVNDTYSCQCTPSPCKPNVGRIPVRTMFLEERKPPSHNAEEWQWWRWNIANKTGGLWYSTVAVGECTQPATQPCFWYVDSVVKRIMKNCSDVQIYDEVTNYNPSCFNGCPQPRNTSSTCWVGCFYETVLGAGAGSGPLSSPQAGMPFDLILKAFEKPFLSSDPSKGGCPAV